MQKLKLPSASSKASGIFFKASPSAQKAETEAVLVPNAFS
jgi:hypothetical protein